MAWLEGVDMTGADLYWALLQDAMLERAVLRDGSFRGAIFNRARMARANLRGADPLDNLGGSTAFRDADLGADLRKARLGGADFYRAKLVRADLRRGRRDLGPPRSPDAVRRRRSDRRASSAARG